MWLQITETLPRLTKADKVYLSHGVRGGPPRTSADAQRPQGPGLPLFSFSTIAHWISSPYFPPRGHKLAAVLPIAAILFQQEEWEGPRRKEKCFLWRGIVFCFGRHSLAGIPTLSLWISSLTPPHHTQPKPHLRERLRHGEFCFSIL